MAPCRGPASSVTLSVAAGRLSNSPRQTPTTAELSFLSAAPAVAARSVTAQPNFVHRLIVTRILPSGGQPQSRVCPGSEGDDAAKVAASEIPRGHTSTGSISPAPPRTPAVGSQPANSGGLASCLQTGVRAGSACSNVCLRQDYAQSLVKSRSQSVIWNGLVVFDRISVRAGTMNL